MAIDRNYLINKMRGRIMKPEEFDYDRLSAPPLYSLLSQDDIDKLRKLATSIRYQAKPIERLKAIDDIMRSRGFVKFAGGTNRVVYRYLEDDSFLIKVASDAVGMRDNPREYMNQFIYKPFVCKIFEVDQSGVVAVVERCMPITSREEFMSIAADVYYVISNWFIGEYVMDDIGTDYFLNWSCRRGFGPVLIDYPYAYKLDGNKLYCNRQLEDGSTCGGVIDYDDGFNHLYCTRCGKRYKAIELKSKVEQGEIVREGGHSKMKVAFGRGDVNLVKDTEPYMDVTPRYKARRRGKKSKVGTLTVQFGRGKNIMGRNVPEEEERAREIAEAGNLKAIGTRGPVAPVRPTERVYREEPEEEVVETTPKVNMITVLDVTKLPEDLEHIESKEGHIVATDKSGNVYITARVYSPTEVNMMINNVTLATEKVIETVEDVPESTPATPSVNEDVSNVSEDDADEDADPYIVFHASIINSMDIDGIEDGKFKCLMLVDDEGNPYYTNGGNTAMIVQCINDRPLDELAILPKSVVAGYQNEKAELEQKMTQLNIDNDSLLRYNGELNNDVDNITKERDALKEKVAELEEKIHNLTEDNDNLVKDKSDLEEQLQASRACNDEILYNSSKSTAEAKIKAEKAEADLKEANDTINGLQGDILRLNDAIADYKEVVAKYKSDAQERMVYQSDLENQIESYKQENASLNTKVTDLQKEIDELREDGYWNESDGKEESKEEHNSKGYEQVFRAKYEATSPFIKKHDEEESGKIEEESDTESGEVEEEDDGDYFDDYDPDMGEPTEEPVVEESTVQWTKPEEIPQIESVTVTGPTVQRIETPPVGAVPPVNLKNQASLAYNKGNSSGIVKLSGKRNSKRYDPRFYNDKGLTYMPK